MPIYVKKLKNLKSGPVSWEDSEDIPLSDIGSLINKKAISPVWSASDAPLIRTDTGTKTLTFVAPEDLTLKNFIIELTQLYSSDTESGTALDYSHLIGVSRMEVVTGTGPDVGYSIFEGNSGVSLGLFSIRNIGFAPKLNIRMAAGDTLEMDIGPVRTVASTVPANFPITTSFTYEDNIDLSVSPKKLLGGLSVGLGFLEPISSGTAASGSITVLNAPGTASIIIDRFVSNDGITFNSSTSLDSGAGTSGTNTYDGTLATITGLRDNIVTSINDSNNDFGDWTASPTGVDTIVITQNKVGASGNYDSIRTGGDFSMTPFSGGTSTSVGSFVFTPTVDIVLKNIFYSAYTDVNPLGSIISPGYIWTHGIEITGLNIAGAPVQIGRSAMPPMNTPIGKKIINVPVSAGSTIEVFARAGIAREAATIAYAIVAELA